MSFQADDSTGVDSSSRAGPSRPSSVPCTICSTPAKYTCPRCSARTCSLPCSKTHKTRGQGCSGMRDPAKYVSLKEYGQGVWADDYKWLEEGRRKVGSWGEGVRVEEVNGSSMYATANGRGRGGGRGGASARGGGRRGKMDGLRRELQKCGCEVEFMPEGMGRRRANQSSWNPKTQQLHLTVQLSIPARLLDTSSSDPTRKITTIPRTLFSTTDSTPLPSVASLLPSSLQSTDLVYTLPFYATPSRPASEHQPGQKLYYSPLDGSKSLVDVLKGTAWVEFPIVHIHARADWESMVERGEMALISLAERVEPVQRDNGWGNKRRLEDATSEAAVKVKKPKIAVEGLLALGEYDSEAEEEEEQHGTEEAKIEVAEDADDHENSDVLDLDDGGEEGDVGEPSMEMLVAVGEAITADFGAA